ncbi:MAG: ABC transporter permease subunit [Acidobacteriota bacterium]
MKADLAFLKLELRRHLNLVLVIALVMLSLPLIHRWSTGRWDYWSGDWPALVTALALGLVIPLAGLAIGLGAWADERSSGTLGWLYSRPLMGLRLFVLRVCAALLLLLSMVLIVVAFNDQSISDLRLLHQDLELPWSQGSVLGVLGVFGAPLPLAIGFFASALASDRNRALLIALGIALILGIVAPLFVWSQGTMAVLLIAGQGLLQTMNFYFLGGGCLVALVAAGWAVRRAPADRSRIMRGLKVFVPGAILLLIGLAGFARVPYGVTSDKPQAVFDLEGDRSLALVTARGLQGHFLHPVLEGGGGSERRLFVTWRDVFPAPDGRGAVLQTADFQQGRVFLSAEGDLTELRLEGLPSARFSPIGWSPDSERFAWWVREGKYWTGLALFEGDGRLRWVPHSQPLPKGYGAHWLDSRSFAVMEIPSRGTVIDHSTENQYRWRVIDLAGKTGLGPTSTLHRGFLYPIFPDWEHSLGLGFGRLADRQVLVGDRWLFRRSVRDVRELALLDPISGEVERWAEERLGLGYGPSGQAVWLENGAVLRSANDGVATEALCSYAFEASFVAFGGVRDDWLVFAHRGSEQEVELFACHAKSGETRTWRRPLVPIRGPWHGFGAARTNPSLPLAPVEPTPEVEAVE